MPRGFILTALKVVFSFVVPGTAAGLPADVETPPGNATYVIEIPLTDTAEATDAAAPPSVEVSVNVKANKAVYINEESPNVNMDSTIEKAHLRVGTSPEFGYKMWTLLSFHPVKEVQAGPLPNDAEVTRARIKLWKESGQSGTIDVHRLMEDFNESSVKWNNKPSQFATAEGSANIPADNGWCYIDVEKEQVTDGQPGHVVISDIDNHRNICLNQVTRICKEGD